MGATAESTTVREHPPHEDIRVNRIDRTSGPSVGPASPELARGALKQRVKPTLGGNNGAHSLSASAPVGIQVIGYGAYTRYQYPGGLDLDATAPPPAK